MANPSAEAGPGICPLLAIANHVGECGFPEQTCLEARCAWWDSRPDYRESARHPVGRCAIVGIAEMGVILSQE